MSRLNFEELFIDDFEEIIVCDGYRNFELVIDNEIIIKVSPEQLGKLGASILNSTIDLSLIFDNLPHHDAELFSGIDQAMKTSYGVEED